MHLPVGARAPFDTPRLRGRAGRAVRDATRASAALVLAVAVGPVVGLSATAAANAAPIGVIDTVTATGDSVTVTGWTLDPDTTAPIAAHVYLDNASVGVTADASRPDVGKAFGKGDRHGYTVTLPATPGKHTVCVYAINNAPGHNPRLGCRTVTVADAAPIGVIDSVAATGSSVTVTGWTLDPDTTAPIAAHVYLDNAGVGVTADASRPDVGKAFGKGDRHGYTVTLPATPGKHTVCVYAINNTPGPNPQLGCRTVTVGSVNVAPIGVIDTVTTTADSVTVTGWTLDPDTTDPISAHVYLGSTSVAVTAAGSRPDVGKAFGKGDRHGYTVTLPATPGKHTVCVYAINNTPGPNPQLGCRTASIAEPGSTAGANASRPSEPAAVAPHRTLSWAPPTLVSPTTVNVSAGNRNLKLDMGRDYVVKMPTTPLDGLNGLTIYGGRNVVLIGGEIRIDAAGTESKHLRGLFLKDQTGTVHVEGLKITGRTLAEGINLDQRRGATVQLQNIRVDTVHGDYDSKHADVLQTWAGPAELRVDGLTGYTGYQGFFLLPQQFGDQPEPRLFDFRNVNIVGQSGSAYMMWRDGRDWPVRTSNVWTSPSRANTSRDSILWPRTAAGRASWQDVRQGVPPTGDFVPANGAGVGYLAPGYAR